jgi:hypothetical protein
MEAERLRTLLRQDESATLEFKREPYAIDSPDSETKKRQRHELVKDILALANGNAIVAGEIAYLIIGADDRLNPDGSRALYDIGENNLSAKRILDIVNPYCAPHMEDLLSETVQLGSECLNVVTLPPTPHLYETTQKLEPSTSGSVSEFVVFTRQNSGVKIASARERDAIARLKRSRFDETRNPPPEPFGALVGAIIGAGIAADLGDRINEERKGKPVWRATGGIVGGISGWLLGRLYRGLLDFKSD